MAHSIVFGADLMPMFSPQASRQPKYAVVIFKDGKIINRLEDVSRRKLVKLTWKFKPSILAIDNVFELASNVRKLIRFLSFLPSSLKVVQVTGSPSSGFKSLSVLVEEHGLSVGGKLSPLQAAEFSAKLAMMNVGYVVYPSRGESRIIVCRKRRPGEGGMSEDRFKRKIRLCVMRISREIKSLLDEHGFDYDMFYRESRSGFDSCFFIVYAPPDVVKGVVKSEDYGDVRVMVRKEYGSKLLFHPLGKDLPTDPMVKNYLIVGVDPGMVTGVAVLNLFGQLLLLTSKRHLSRSALINLLIDYGQPILIASDVNPPPTFVQKLASMLNASLFVPSQNLTSAEKQSIIKNYLDDFKPQLRSTMDSHMKDALSAAVKAYMSFKNKFEQAEAHARELNVLVPVKQLRALIVKGYNIRDAIEKLKIKYKSRKTDEKLLVEKRVKPKPPVSSEEVELLKKKLKAEKERVQVLLSQKEQLMGEIERLNRRIRELEETIQSLRSEISLELRRQREIASLELRVNQLTKIVNSLNVEREKLMDRINKWRKLFIKILGGSFIALKPVKNLTKDDVFRSIRLYNIGRDDAVYVYDLSVADDEAIRELARVKVKCVIGDYTPPNHILELFEEYVIPFILAGDVELTWIDEFPIARRDLVNVLSERIKSELIRKSEERELSRLKALFDEYRRERIGDLKDFNSSF